VTVRTFPGRRGSMAPLLRRLALAVAPVVAWLLTGTAPFTADAYVLVAILVLVTFVGSQRASFFSPRSREELARPNRRGQLTALGIAPWAVLVTLAVALEAFGLALGGRSPSVPTLSTTVDHLLVDHESRFGLCLLWLVAWWAPALRSVPGAPPPPVVPPPPAVPGDVL